jgi:hypothetical protein
MDLEYFFRLILFDNPAGAFVLFGSKPLCEISYFDTEGDLKSPFTRNPSNGWKALQKALGEYPLKRYIFTLRPENRGSIILADIQKTALILAENYDVFKSYAGMDFHPLEIVFELDDPDSKFWKQIFSYKNHLAMGLLFGFGKQNALMWSWNSSLRKKPGKAAEYCQKNPMRTSTPRIFIESGTLARDKIRIGSGPEDFEIPFFGIVEGDSRAEQYAREKKKIEAIYRGQNLVEVTLRRLAS